MVVGGSRRVRRCRPGAWTYRTRSHVARCHARRPTIQVSRLSRGHCLKESVCGIKIEAIDRAFYHAFCGQDLGLPDRDCRFDINNNAVVDIDQIVGGISEECLSAMGSGPSRCRIGRRDRTWSTTSVAAPKASSSSTAIYSLTARPVASGGSPFSPSLPFRRLASRLDQTGIDRKGFAMARPDPQRCSAAGPSQRRIAGEIAHGGNGPCRFLEKVE